MQCNKIIIFICLTILSHLWGDNTALTLSNQTSVPLNYLTDLNLKDNQGNWLNGPGSHNPGISSLAPSSSVTMMVPWSFQGYIYPFSNNDFFMYPTSTPKEFPDLPESTFVIGTGRGDSKKILLTEGINPTQVLGGNSLAIATAECTNDLEIIKNAYNARSKPFPPGFPGRPQVVDPSPSCAHYQQTCWKTLRPTLDTFVNTANPDEAYNALQYLWSYFGINQTDQNALNDLLNKLRDELGPVSNICSTTIRDISNIQNVTQGNPLDPDDQPLIVFGAQTLGFGGVKTANVNIQRLQDRVNFAMKGRSR